MDPRLPAFKRNLYVQHMKAEQKLEKGEASRNYDLLSLHTTGRPEITMAFPLERHQHL